MAMRLTERRSEGLAERVPDAPMSSKSGRHAMNTWKTQRGVCWTFDIGAKWKDRPCGFGSKSAVHRWFILWVRKCGFESIMRDAGEIVEERGGYRPYECFIDATIGKARASAVVTQAGKG